MLGQGQRPLAGSGLWAQGSLPEHTSPPRPHCMSRKTQAAADLCSSTFSLPLYIPLPHPQTLPEAEGNTFREALELSGTPFPYFPEMIPQASGDQVIAPTPAEEKQLEKLLVGNWDPKCGVFTQDWLVVGKSRTHEKSSHQHTSFY